jgi:diguanylate cyclase (GGDEF)-like protein
LGNIGSLLRAFRHRPWPGGQCIGIVSALLLIGVLLAPEFEAVLRLREGDATVHWAGIVEVLALAALLGLSIATGLACRNNEKTRISERKLRAQVESEARGGRALQDRLTELPNAQGLLAVLTDTIERSRDAAFALHLLDLDGFQSVNTAYGSATGDAILRVVALRLRSVARREDLIARVEGDAFAVLARDVQCRHEAIDIGQRYAAALDEPICLDNRFHAIGVTVGLAFYPEDGTTTDELMRHADRAVRAERALQRSDVPYFVAPANAPAA